MNISMRTRLMLTTSMIVMVLVGVLSTGIYSTFSRQLVRQVDKSLDDRVIMIADSLRRANSMQNPGRRLRNPLDEALLPTRFDTVTQVIDVNGCIDVANGNIEVQEPFLFFIPTGFTPNGDNINDALQIVSNDLDETVFEMTIFNRWGQTVFHTNDPRMPWMGQQMDSEYYVPNGVYMWNATVRAKATGEKKEINGTITITR